MSPSNEAADLITSALDEVSAASTLRAGRLLAPLGIRYVVVPEFDGVVSTVNDPLPLPVGLISSLEDQLDLVAIEPRSADAGGLRESSLVADGLVVGGLDRGGEHLGGTRSARTVGPG